MDALNTLISFGATVIAALASTVALVYRDRIKAGEKERDNLLEQNKQLRADNRELSDKILDDTKELATSAVLVLKAKTEAEGHWATIAAAINRAYDDRPRPR